MSKFRTTDQNSPHHLVFTVIEVMQPIDEPAKAQQWCLHACAGNVYVAKAAYAMVKERYPGKPVMLLDGKRIIGVSWQGT